MRIERIQAQNVLAINDIDIRVNKPILLVAAHNGAGKSAIADCIKMALTRELPRGIDHKKNLDMLVNDGGARAGGALITCNDDQAFGFALPKGKFDGDELPDAMKVAIDGQRFSAMTPDQRRTFLFALTGRRVTAQYVKDALTAAGCVPALIDEVLPTLRTGIADACEYAKDKAKASKTLWNNVTGGTWGPKIAEGWAAPLPEVPAGDVAALRQHVAGLDAVIATQTEALGAIRQAVQTAAADVQRRAQLEASVKRVPELEKLLPAAIAERDEYQKKVDALRERAKGTARVGLVHDLARFVFELNPTDAPTATAQAKLMAAYTKEHGAITAAGAADPEAVAGLPEHERGLQVLVNRAANLQRDLDGAKMAKGQYDALEPAADAVDASTEIAEVEQALAAAKAERQTAQSAIQAIEAAQKLRADADGKTKTAAAHHANVTAWLAIAEQLAPAGIPARLLKEALAPVNEKLHQAAVDAEWPRVVIHDDMSITVEKDPDVPRLYQLESASYRWRADAMIAQVVATMSGLKILVLDAVDVLQPSARPELFSWVDLLVAEGDLDSVVLLAALERPPVDLLDTFQLCWLRDGTVVQSAHKAAA
jgi:energy-coupling factor transporter ATP-binding protein EcfA2